MSSKIVYFLLFLFPFTLSAQTRNMTETEASAFQKSLQRAAQIQTLSADFVQRKHMSFMKKPVESAGKIYLKHPDRFSWSYTTPFQYKMVYKDRKVFINEKGQTKTLDIGNSKQFEKISNLVSSSMRGAVYDEREFAVSYLKKDGANAVKLVPKLKEAKKYIKEILLVFSKADRQVEEVVLTEPSGDYTTFTLKNRKVNAQINESVFNL